MVLVAQESSLVCAGITGDFVVVQGRDLANFRPDCRIGVRQWLQRRSSILGIAGGGGTAARRIVDGEAVGQRSQGLVHRLAITLIY